MKNVNNKKRIYIRQNFRYTVKTSIFWQYLVVDNNFNHYCL